MANKRSNLILYATGAAILLLLISSTANAAASMVSDAQLSEIASYETFRATAYPDGSNNGVQLYSIGYGHQIQPSESYLLTSTISQDQGQALLLQDLQSVVDAISRSNLQLTQGQFDALTDFGYNAGIGALNKILNTLSANGADAATNEMSQYIYWHPVPGGAAQINQSLVDRRNREIEIFNS